MMSPGAIYTRIKIFDPFDFDEGDIFEHAYKSAANPPLVSYSADFFLKTVCVSRNYIKWAIAQQLAFCLQNQTYSWAVDDHHSRSGLGWEDDEKQMLVYQKQIADELLPRKPDEFQEPCLTLEDWRKQLAAVCVGCS